MKFRFFVLLGATFAISSSTLAAQLNFEHVMTCARNVDIVHSREKNVCFALSEDGALREKHNRLCGGDTQTSPTRAWFSMEKVGRTSVLGYESGGESWQACEAE